MSRLYYEEVKQRYLQTYDNEGTRKTINNLFIKSAITEETLKKDLYNFSTDDLVDVFKNINPKSGAVALSSGRFIKQYISWCITNGYRDNNDNPLNGVNKEWFLEFVDRNLKIHYSYDEFIDILESLPNAQDQCFLALIWCGISGRNFSELRELHYNDINWNENEITIRERNNEVVKISDVFMRYVKNAYHQITYYTYNDETNEHSERELITSDYVFKNVKSPRTKDGDVVSQAVFYTRLTNLRKEFEIELTPNSIRQSGMIYTAAKIYEEKLKEDPNAKLEYADFEKIGDKYQFSKLFNNGYEYFNTTLMKEFISVSNLKDLYNLDVKM